jgi:hypothetical protein
MPVPVADWFKMLMISYCWDIVVQKALWLNCIILWESSSNGGICRPYFPFVLSHTGLFYHNFFCEMISAFHSFLFALSHPDDGGSRHLWNVYRTTRRYNPEDRHHHTCRRENLKSYLKISKATQVGRSKEWERVTHKQKLGSKESFVVNTIHHWFLKFLWVFTAPP